MSSRAEKIDAMRWRHVRRSLKKARRTGVIDDAIISARLRSIKVLKHLPPARVVPGGPDTSWIRSGRTPGCQHEWQRVKGKKRYKRCKHCSLFMARKTGKVITPAPMPPWLEGRELFPEHDWHLGPLRLHKYVRATPSVTPLRIDGVEMETYNLYVRTSKAYKKYLLKRWAGTTQESYYKKWDRWRYLGFVTLTTWHRVAKFLRKKPTKRLKPEMLYVHLFSVIYKRDLPKRAATCAFHGFLAKKYGYNE